MATRKRLEEIPSGIYDLIGTIMTKRTDTLTECVTLLQWMLVSKRELSAYELYLGIQSRHALSNTDQVGELDSQVVSRYILDCSRGLVELTTGPDPRVQFIHETVRQFLIATSRNGAQVLLLAGFDFQSEACHTVVAEGCLDYLLYVCRVATWTEEFLQKYPLVHYSALYWWQHMQATHGKYSRRAEDLAEDLLTGSVRNLLGWVRI